MKNERWEIPKYKKIGNLQTLQIVKDKEQPGMSTSGWDSNQISKFICDYSMITIKIRSLLSLLYIVLHIIGEGHLQNLQLF